MARTESNTELPLGSLCPGFALQDVVSGATVSRDDVFRGVGTPARQDGTRSATADVLSGAPRGVLVAFLSVHCPFVQHMQQAFAEITRDYAGRIGTVAIQSNDVANYPEDAPEHMRAQAARLGWQFPYLFDEAQEIARAFRAACTPDLYLFNAAKELVYHAQFDGTRPYRSSDEAAGHPRVEAIHRPADGSDLRRAFDALLAGQPPLAEQRPSLGCNIKWKS